MFEFIIILSRYLFIFYIGFFLWQGLIYVLDERKKEHRYLKRAASLQRISIVFMHISAFLILSYNPGQFSFSISTLILGVLGLIYFIFGSFAVGRVYRKSCPILWNSMFFLLDLSLIMLERLNPVLAQKQLLWMCISTAMMLAIPFILRIIPRFENLGNFYLIFALLLIIAPFFFGSEEYGSLNWIYIKNFGFQPSEIVKFLFIFYLVASFQKTVELKELLITGGFSAFLVLILVYQRDLGGALIFFTTYIFLLYIATSNALLLFGGLGGASIAAIFAYRIFPHIRVRVAAWKNPWIDIDRGGYQIAQSLFAITTWGFLGSGLTRGMPQSIPVVEKDFIFSAICEEFGGMFAICVIGIYILFFLRGILIAMRCKKRFFSLLAAGVVIMLSFQAFLILGGVMKIIPLTGVTLPYISYGGTSVLVSILMAGLLQWVNVYCESYCKEGEKK